jgi:hypothetical protein
MVPLRPARPAAATPGLISDLDQFATPPPSMVEALAQGLPPVPPATTVARKAGQ